MADAEVKISFNSAGTPMLRSLFRYSRVVAVALLVRNIVLNPFDLINFIALATFRRGLEPRYIQPSKSKKKQ